MSSTFDTWGAIQPLRRTVVAVQLPVVFRAIPDFIFH